jgi:hypothetical protein
LKNFAPAKNWLLVNCVGSGGNRDAIGAQVRLYVGGRRLFGQVQSGTSFLSQNDPRVHFGVGDVARYEKIEVRWPNGVTEGFQGGETNRIVTLEQSGSRK